MRHDITVGFGRAIKEDETQSINSIAMRPRVEGVRDA